MEPTDTQRLDNLEGVLRELQKATSALRSGVADLSDRIPSLEGGLREVGSAIGDHDVALQQVAGEIGQMKSGGGPGDAGAPQSAKGGQWTAYEADPPALRVEMDNLRAWVAWANPTLFWYRMNQHVLPACWEQHPGVVEELLALYSAWREAYTGKKPNQARVYWHQVYLGPTLDRVMKEYALKACEGGHRNPGSTAPAGADRAQAAQAATVAGPDQGDPA